MRFSLTIEYDGTDFHGWQLQPSCRTVQGALEEALATMVGEQVRVAAAGRTDAGVHAAGQVVSFDLAREWSVEVLQRGLNALTPRDLTIREASVVADDFDPRRAASSREYEYRIFNARWVSPFWSRFALHIARPLDVDAMQEAAVVLLGEHDFSSFQGAGCDAEHAVRRILVSEVARRGEIIRYRIEATAFLRHMVRNIIGTLIEVGEGRRPPESMADLLAARDRTRAGITAGPQGLTLRRVRYLPRVDT